MIRTALEKLTDGWRFTRSLEVGGERVRLVVSTSGGLRYLGRLSRVDPLLVALACDLVKPGDIVWDVGANLGLFSFVAARLAGPGGSIVAFEPDAWLVETLQRSQRLQPATSASVVVRHAAVASASGSRQFNIARRARASNHLAEYGSSQAGGIRETVTVQAVTLDSCLESSPAPSVLKIDIEGAEVEALRGASRVLSQCRVVVCETSRRHREEVTGTLRGAGFDLYDGETRAASEFAPWSTLAIRPK